MADSGTYTPETIARRLKIAEALLGERKKPITHWAEGLDELAKGYFGGKLYSDAEKAEKGNEAAQTAALSSLLGGGGQASSPAPMSAPAVPAAPAQMDASNLPRGLRNNNPLNIEAGDFTQGQPGFVGSDGRFAKFDTPESGIGAANKLLDIYQNKHGLNTVSGIVGRWAPAKDNNNVNAYAQSVAQKLGIDPNAPIPPEMRPQLIAAMGQHENGRPIGDVATLLSKPSIAPQMMAQATPSVSGQPLDTKAAIAKMLADPNPTVQRMGRTLATSIIQKQLEGEKPTNDIREYEMAKRQGFPGTLLDYQTKLKEAGKPVTNINQMQEGEYEKTMGKEMAQFNMEIPKSAASARGKMATLDRMGQLLSDKGITTGAGANTILEAKRLAKQMGVDVGDLGPAEAVRAIGNQFALELRNPSGGAGMPGALSDKDREFLQASVPGLQQNPEGNKLIVDYMKRVAQRSLDVERLRQQYVRKNKRLDEGFFSELADYADAHPLFPEAATPTPGPAATQQAPSIDDLLRKYGGAK